MCDVTLSFLDTIPGIATAKPTKLAKNTAIKTFRGNPAISPSKNAKRTSPKPSHALHRFYVVAQYMTHKKAQKTS
ncbi:MAG: hypothetical protein R3B12_00785 [Candidatus Saccharimonadales bacterium]